jgi:hypothetical protein
VTKSWYFMVLDEQSWNDRKIELIHKSVWWEDAEGENCLAELDHVDSLLKKTEWRRFRVPFEEVVDIWTLLDVMPGMVNNDNEFLEAKWIEDDA